MEIKTELFDRLQKNDFEGIEDEVMSLAMDGMAYELNYTGLMLAHFPPEHPSVLDNWANLQQWLDDIKISGYSTPWLEQIMLELGEDDYEETRKPRDFFLTLVSIRGHVIRSVSNTDDYTSLPCVEITNEGRSLDLVYLGGDVWSFGPSIDDLMFVCSSADYSEEKGFYDDSPSSLS